MPKAVISGCQTRLNSDQNEAPIVRDLNARLKRGDVFFHAGMCIVRVLGLEFILYKKNPYVTAYGASHLAI